MKADAINERRGITAAIKYNKKPVSTYKINYKPTYSKNEELMNRLDQSELKARIANEQSGLMAAQKFNEYKGIVEPTVTPSNLIVTPNLVHKGLQPLPDSIEERANKLREHNQQYQTEFPDIELEDENTYVPPTDEQIERFVEEERAKLTRKYQKLENDLRETDKHIQNIIDDVNTGRYENNRPYLKKAEENYNNFMREREKIIKERENVNIELNQTKEKFIKEELEREKVQRSNIKRRNEEKITKALIEYNNYTGKHIQGKFPYESEEQYLERLKTEARQFQRNALLTEKINGEKDFRNKLKEIERRNFVIEDVINGITEEEMYIVISQWPAFYKKYTETYGKFSPYQTPTTIIKFIKDFFNSNFLGSNIPTAEVEGFISKDKDEIVRRINILLATKEITENTIETAFSHYFPKKNVKKFDTKVKNLSEKYLKNPDESLESFLNLNVEPLSSYKKKRSSSKSEMEGGGLRPEKIPNVVDLGRIKIMLKKLYYDNILSVRKGPYKASIAGFSQAKVSEKMVQIILNLVSGVFPTSKDLDMLPLKEKPLFDRLIYLAGIHKKTENNANKSVDFLKGRFKILDGEIRAGNNNPEIVKELRSVVHALKDMKHVNNKSAVDYLNQLK
jgi:hypothetical protein